MNAQGFLPLTLIASFQRVQNLTMDIDLVITAVMESDKLEVMEFEDGYKVLQMYFKLMKYHIFNEIECTYGTYQNKKILTYICMLDTKFVLK